jgi:hypothetical protein
VRPTNENLLLWEQRINERIRSGMTIVDWCEKNGISKHKYHYWNHHIRQNQKSDKEVAFAEVTPILSNTDDETQSNPDKYADFQVFLNNIQVTVPSNFNPGALTGLLKVLKEL